MGQVLVPTKGSAVHTRRAAVATQALFGGIQKMIEGDPSEKTRKKYQARVDKINQLAPKMEVRAVRRGLRVFGILF